MPCKAWGHGYTQSSALAFRGKDQWPNKAPGRSSASFPFRVSSKRGCPQRSRDNAAQHSEPGSCFECLTCFPPALNLRPLSLVERKWRTAAYDHPPTSAISQDDPVRQARVIRANLVLSKYGSLPVPVGHGLAG